MGVTRVEKPWGHELHWAKTERYVGKVLHIKAGHALSLQYHNVKDETIYLYSGRMLFEIERNGALTKEEMRPGDVVHVIAQDRPSHDGDRGLRCARSVDAGTRRRRADRGPLRTAGQRTGSLKASGYPGSRRPSGLRSVQKGMSSSVSGSTGESSGPAGCEGPRSIPPPRPPPPSSVTRSALISVV